MTHVKYLVISIQLPSGRDDLHSLESLKAFFNVLLDGKWVATLAKNFQQIIVRDL